MTSDAKIVKVSRGRNQNRVTVPKDITSDYVALVAVKIPRVEEAFKKNAKK